MIDSYPMTHCPHGKSLREHCGACEKLDLAEQHQQERVAQLEARVADLLEVLKAFVAAYDGFEDADGNPCPVVKQAKTAIARAEGKAQ